MFTYIASHHRGATRYDASSVAELVQDIATAAGPHNGPDTNEAQQLLLWTETSKPGDLLEWRQGWVFCRSAIPATEVTS